MFEVLLKIDCLTAIENTLSQIIITHFECTLIEISARRGRRRTPLLLTKV